MGRIFTELVKKHGFGLVMAAITLDGYRRQVTNDNNNNVLERIQRESAAAQQKANLKDKEDYLKIQADTHEKAKNSAVMGRYQEAADSHHSAANAHKANPTEYRKNEMDRAKTKIGRVI